MTLREYIEEHYPIRDKIERIKSDPRKQIMDSDFLPCDDVKFINGELQKAVQLEDGEWVAVMDFLTHEPDDVRKMNIKEEWKQAYFAYMEYVSNDDVAFADIMSAVREYKTHMARKKELVANVQNSAG